MSSLQIEFDWYCDAAGYDLVESKWPVKARSRHRTPAALLGMALPTHIGSGGQAGKLLCIVRRGGELKRYSPLRKFNNLFEQFARKVVSPESLLDFINQYGPLSRYGLDSQFGENVGFMLENAKAMNMVLTGYCRGKRGLVEAMGPDGMPLGDIGVKLVVDPSNRATGLKLSLGIRDLYTAMWVQLGQSLSVGSSMRQCGLCQELFAVGPGTGRRADARFCSDEHRINWNSRRRTEKEN
jgi:hypothetical protein